MSAKFQCHGCEAERIAYTVTVHYPFGDTPKMHLCPTCLRRLQEETAAILRDTSMVEVSDFIQPWMNKYAGVAA